jgi:hypothetical protein
MNNNTIRIRRIHEKTPPLDGTGLKVISSVIFFSINVIFIV